MNHYLMVDLGTGNTRVALVRSDGEIVDLRNINNRYYRDDSYSDAQYFFPREWEEEILRCCDELHAAHPDIRVCAMSSAGARQTIVLVDREGEAFYALPNIDNRGRDYMDSVPDQEEIYRLSGKWVTEDFCAAKIMGLKKLYPEMYERIGTVLSLSEWIAYIFSGKLSMEPSQACETQLYDLEKRDWSEKICEAYGISPHMLPPLLPAGAVIGGIKPALIEKYGMDENAVFIMGGADTQIAVKQTGMDVGDIAVVSGTTSPVLVITEDKYYDEQQRVWTDANLGGETFAIEMNPGVTGLNYQRIKNDLCPDLSYEYMEEMYGKKEDFLCTASFSSLLFYERRSLRRGGFFMRSPLQPGFDRIDMAWAVLADIACSIYEQLRRLRSLTHNESSTVLCCGGGFRSGTLCQMLSDLSGLELKLRGGFEQATVAGLVSICNEALGLSSASLSEDITIYKPISNSLIHKYYPLWLENREKANTLN